MRWITARRDPVGAREAHGKPARRGVTAASPEVKGAARLPRCAAVLLSLLALGLGACGTQFDSIGQVEGVRVLGVRKSNPYAKPGETVELQLLYHDTGAVGRDQPRELSFFWLSGCENPRGDSYAGCFEQFGEVFAAAEFDLREPGDIQTLVETANKHGIGLGLGDRHSFQVSEDILSGREPLGGVTPTRYGLNYVFFAVCAGELRADPQSDSFPLGCFDDQDERLGPRDFVAGYTSIYSYETLTNSNPVIRGVRVAGKRLDDDDVCIDEQCEPLPRRQASCPPQLARVPACDDEDDFTKTCPALEVSVLVNEDSVDVDETFVGAERGAREQMWVTYHADRGKFDNDLALISDRVAGFRPRPAAKYLASEVAGPVYLWAVVRDNRGGTSWARFQVCVE